MVQWEVLDAECDEETRQAKDLGSITSLYEVVKLTYFHPSDEVHHHHPLFVMMKIVMMMFLMCLLFLLPYTYESEGLSSNLPG